MLRDLQLRNFRCFDALAVRLAPDFNFFVGANGQGKTSILEAACVLLRLQSQRSSTLAPLVKFGSKWFAVSGNVDAHTLDFRYSALRRKIAFDGVDQSSPDEYLRAGRAVSFANTDIELVRGTSEPRRRFLDFIGSQIDAKYRPTLRAYERALRSRNALLKSAQPRPREIAAYDQPLIEQGLALAAMRAKIVADVIPFAVAAYADVSGTRETLGITLARGNAEDFAADLANSRPRELRLRQTVVGPHRDDIELLMNGKPASQFASEGQQRTIALALKIAQAAMFNREDGAAPLLLIDDIFGELDADRRNALLRALPANSQKLVTATGLPWRETDGGTVFELANGALTTCETAPRGL